MNEEDQDFDQAFGSCNFTIQSQQKRRTAVRQSTYSGGKKIPENGENEEDNDEEGQHYDEEK